jgi:hypothetical protein
MMLDRRDKMLLSHYNNKYMCHHILLSLVKSTFLQDCATSVLRYHASCVSFDMYDQKCIVNQAAEVFEGLLCKICKRVPAHF